MLSIRKKTMGAVPMFTMSGTHGLLWASRSDQIRRRNGLLLANSKAERLICGELDSSWVTLKMKD